MSMFKLFGPPLSPVSPEVAQNSGGIPGTPYAVVARVETSDQPDVAGRDVT